MRLNFERLSLLNEQAITYRVCTSPFRLAEKLEVPLSVRFLRALLMFTLAATVFLPYRLVFALLIIGDVMGILLSSKAEQKLKVIDILVAVFALEIVTIFAVFSRSEEFAECLVVTIALILFYFMLCLYVKRENIERMFVLCCSILSIERLLTITISGEAWHDNRQATFQLLIFALPLCLKRIILKRYSVKTKVIYGILTVLIAVPVIVPFFYDGWQIPGPREFVQTLNEYRLPLGTALLEFWQNILITLSSLNPVFSVSAVLSVLLLFILILTETLSEKNNPLTILAAALAVAGGGVSGFLAENIRLGLWQNINLLIIFWALIAVVRGEEEENI